MIRGYTPTRHDRFTNFTTTPSFNPTFMHSALDLTGVGWDTGNQARQLTMVSPIHFIGANHYRPGIGATLQFLSSDGTIQSYTVANQSTITSDAGDATDLFIGTLNTPIPSDAGITYHPYLNLRKKNGINPYGNYINQNTIFLGKTARGTRGVIDSIQNRTVGTVTNKMLIMRYDLDSGGIDDAYLESGDSGSPVFIEQDGLAAIVGTNSGISGPDSNNIMSSVCSFIPHYVDNINAIMATQGYHLAKAIPGNTSLTLSRQLPSAPYRAGHPLTIDLTLNNTGDTLAENVKLRNAFSLTVTDSTTRGSGWLDESNPSAPQSRRASLSTSAFTTCQITITPTTLGTYQHQVSYFSDQSSTQNQTFNFDVIESFVSWTTNLSDKTSEGDDDQDLINNLLEYAFGGDPITNSQHFPGTTTPLLPSHVITENTIRITHLRRTDYTTKALNYRLTSSSTLADGSWEDATSLISQITVTPINPEFEQVTLEFPLTSAPKFFRIEVTLSE